MFIRFFKKLSKNLVVLFIFLILFELVLFLFWPQPFGSIGEINTKSGLRWNPPGKYLVNWFAGKTFDIKFDENGFRVSPNSNDTEVLVAPKVVVLGGSISNGYPFNISFVDSIKPYQVTNCSLAFTNLATLNFIAHNQCADAIKKKPEFLIVQLSISPILGDVFTPLALFFGENLIEEPGLFYSDVSTHGKQYFDRVKYRTTGAPYIDYNPDQILGPFFAWNFYRDTGLFKLNTFRYFYNFRNRVNQKSNLKEYMDTNKILFNKIFTRFPTSDVSLSIFQDLQSFVGSETQVIALMIPDESAMLLSKKRSEYLAKWNKNPYHQLYWDVFAGQHYQSLEEYLDIYEKTMNIFKKNLHSHGIRVVDETETLAELSAEKLFMQDHHHVSAEAQSLIATDLIKELNKNVIKKSHQKTEK